MKDTRAQIVFKPFKSYGAILKESPQPDTAKKKQDSSILEIPQAQNKGLNLLGGEISNSIFEVVQGGNNLAMQAVLINLDSSRILNDTLLEVIPIGMAYRGIYWGLGKHYFELHDVNVPFVVCVLPKDSGKFETFRSEYSQSPDLKWVEIPQKKDSTQSVFKPLSIDEYLLPLPCTHDLLYIEYLNDTMFNMTVDFDTYNEISMVRCFELLELHFEHMKRVHVPYCERQVQVFFSHRNVNMASIRLFFERFSELNVQLRLIFSETEKNDYEN